MTEILSKHSGQMVGLKIGGGLLIAGQAYDVTLGPNRRGAFDIELAAEISAGEGECKRLTKSLVAAVDQDYGPLAPLRRESTSGLALQQAMAGKEIWYLEGGQWSGPETLRPAAGAPFKGGRSVIDERRWEAEVTWQTGRRAAGSERTDVLVITRYAVRKCSLQVHLRSTPLGYTADEWLDFSKSFRSGPSIRVAHYSLEGVAVPAQGVRVNLACQVSRSTGIPVFCREDAGAPVGQAFLNAAQVRISDMVFDPAPGTPEDRTPLLVKVAIELKSSDRKVMTEPDRPALAKVVWTALPTQEDVDRHYPVRAQRVGKSGAAVASCQVQADGTLICPRAISDTRDYGFEQAALEIMRYYRAGPNLADGWFGTRNLDHDADNVQDWLRLPLI